MATNYIRTNVTPQKVGSTRLLTIPTSPATLIVSLSGYMGWQLVCLGPGALAYGDASVSSGTGALLYYSMVKEYYPIADTMSLLVVADSVATRLLLNEYL